MSELQNKFYKTVNTIERKITKHYKKKLYDRTAARYSKIMNIAAIAGTAVTVILATLSGGMVRELYFDLGPAAITLVALISVLFIIGFYGIANQITTRRGYWESSGLR